MPPTGRSGERSDPWGSFEPYAQLFRSLLPRAASVAIYDIDGELRWSSETTTGPDLVNFIDELLPTARTDPTNAGQMRVVEGGGAVYVCCLRNDAGKLVALVAIVCRGTNAPESRETRSFRRSNVCDATSPRGPRSMT
jgi:hypothetical protein